MRAANFGSPVEEAMSSWPLVPTFVVRIGKDPSPRSTLWAVKKDLPVPPLEGARGRLIRKALDATSMLSELGPKVNVRELSEELNALKRGDDPEAPIKAQPFGPGSIAPTGLVF